jgi:hypothetical protein
MNIADNIITEEEDQGGDVDLVRMLRDYLARFENTVQDDGNGRCDAFCNGEGTMPEEDMEENNIEIRDTTELWEQSRIPLFEGSTMNRLVVPLLLLNCFTVFGVSIAFADELLKLLKELLPSNNTLPRSHYEAKKYLSKLGLSDNSIHACRNGCCLFRNELKHAQKCPKCSAERYTSPSSKQPIKVSRHFSLIPRLRQMFRCTRLAELSKWHASRQRDGNKVQCVPDSKAWSHIDSLFPDFGRESRNIRLGLASDGVNPFSNQSLSHSTWPVVLLNYNLPPWLVTKRFFLMLVLLIPGKESVTADNIDVYLAPLIEELLELWEGVTATDVSTEGEERKFRLRAILMWCIHDLPAYGLVSGQVTKGYKGCPKCGPNITTQRSKALGKNVYMEHRRYLSKSHPYRKLRTAFDRNAEMRPPPRVMIGRDIVRYLLERISWLNDAQQRRAAAESDPVHRMGVKRLSSLYKLPYWKVRTPTPIDRVLFVECR